MKANLFGVALKLGQRFFDSLAGAVGRVPGFGRRHQGESSAQGIGGFAIAVIFVVRLGKHFVELKSVGLASPARRIKQS